MATIDMSIMSVQVQSPLFDLPAEVRTRIYEYALSDTDDIDAAKVHALDLGTDIRSKKVSLIIRAMEESVPPSCSFAACPPEFAICPWLGGCASWS